MADFRCGLGSISGESTTYSYTDSKEPMKISSAKVKGMRSQIKKAQNGTIWVSIRLTLQTLTISNIFKIHDFKLTLSFTAGGSQWNISFWEKSVNNKLHIFNHVFLTQTIPLSNQIVDEKFLFSEKHSGSYMKKNIKLKYHCFAMPNE